MKNTLHNIVAVGRVVLARLRFIVVFVVAALVVGYWDNIKNYTDKWTRPALAPDSLAGTAAADVEFYCTMHPNVIRSEPGNCPICGMPLTKRKKGEQQRLPADVLARVQLTPHRVALANVRTSPIEFRDLAYEVRALGILDYDESRVARLSARVAGRADKVFVTHAGQSVKQGDPLYSLYSPEVYTALREYLLAATRAAAVPTDAPEGTRADAATVRDASRERLLLWGLTEQQLGDIAATYAKTGKVPSDITVTSPIAGVVVAKNLFQGGYVQVGENVYTVADRSTLWLQAKLYERDVPLVRLGDVAMVAVDAMPSEPYTGKVTFKAIQLDPQTRTLDARIEVANPGLRLAAGMFATATLRVPVAKALPPPPATTKPVPVIAQGDVAAAFAAALSPYLKAQKLLAQDKTDGVPVLLQEVAAKLKPVAAAPELAGDFTRLSDAASASAGQPINDIRKSFKDVSAVMLAVGQSTGVPTGAPHVQPFRCAMAKATWLQEPGEKVNPYMGTRMSTCGDEAGSLPTFDPTAAATRPATRAAAATGRVLAVPRSAVIDTGRGKVVYVQSAEGVYDMRAVKVGPVAGDFYPVLDGLEDGQAVVTLGAFLVDAENRLNPMAQSGTDDHAGHTHGGSPAAMPATGMSK